MADKPFAGESGRDRFYGELSLGAGGTIRKTRPDKFDLKIDEADAAELARLFAPALLRERGFLARTLRLGANAPIPAWLKAIRAEGAVSIDSLTAGDVRLQRSHGPGEVERSDGAS